MKLQGRIDTSIWVTCGLSFYLEQQPHSSIDHAPQFIIFKWLPLVFWCDFSDIIVEDSNCFLMWLLAMNCFPTKPYVNRVLNEAYQKNKKSPQWELLLVNNCFLARFEKSTPTQQWLSNTHSFPQF
jgi:hypothetical protein